MSQMNLPCWYVGFPKYFTGAIAQPWTNTILQNISIQLHSKKDKVHKNFTKSEDNSSATKSTSFLPIRFSPETIAISRTRRIKSKSADVRKEKKARKIPVLASTSQTCHILKLDCRKSFHAHLIFYVVKNLLQRINSHSSRVFRGNLRERRKNPKKC